MREEKIWYIDRSKNYYYKDLPRGLEAIVEKYRTNNGVIISTDELIETLVKSGVIQSEAANKNAHITRFRDHGFINMYNNPGESTIDYVEKRLSLDSLIVDHFIKRPMYKDKSDPDVKPFILLCRFFSLLFKTTIDTSEYYITTLECKNYLYKCECYDDLNESVIKQIISDRHSGVLSSKVFRENEDTNFSIWFNALSLTSIMLPDRKRDELKPNYFARPLFDFLSENADKLSTTPPCDEKGDASLQYEYYCSRSTGINEILPNYIKSNIRFDSELDIEILYKFLFGLKYDRDFKYEKYVRNKTDAFGVYNSLLVLPDLAFRHIWMQNTFIAERLYEYCLFRKNVFDEATNDSLEKEVEKIELKIVYKKEAMEFLKIKNILINKPYNYAKLSSDGKEYWINPKKERINEDWTIILNDFIKRKLMILEIPSKEFSLVGKKRLLLRSDRRTVLDIRLNKDTLVDNTSKESFMKYMKKVIDY